MFRSIDPYDDICPFCLDELRRGVPEDGRCGHEQLLATYPHLRFNAHERLGKEAYEASARRYREANR